MSVDEAWDFIVRRYQEPGRAQALLAEQERSGLDIVLHLFAEYLSERHACVLDDALQAEARALVAGWRADVVSPLRTVRRLLKQAESELGAPTDSLAQLRAMVQAAELRSERVQLEMLCRWWAARA